MEKKISVGYDCYKSIVIDNEDLRNENESLEEAVEQLTKELQEVKSEHTMDQARVVFAHHILNGCRDEQVLIHQDKKAQEVVFWRMKSDKYFYEMEHYQKSNKAWQTKYESLFQKHQELLGAIVELENVIDDYQKHKRCCKK
jgi:FtsZ-binding cell division protein ZapB